MGNYISPDNRIFENDVMKWCENDVYALAYLYIGSYTIAEK